MLTDRWLTVAWRLLVVMTLTLGLTAPGPARAGIELGNVTCEFLAVEAVATENQSSEPPQRFFALTATAGCVSIETPPREYDLELAVHLQQRSAGVPWHTVRTWTFTDGDAWPVAIPTVQDVTSVPARLPGQGERLDVTVVADGQTFGPRYYGVASVSGDALIGPLATTALDQARALEREQAEYGTANASCTLSHYSATPLQAEPTEPTEWTGQALATTECLSIDQQLPTLGMQIEIQFQQWLERAWRDIDEEPGSCYRTFTVIGHETCRHEAALDTHYLTTSWYRARFVVSVDGHPKLERFALLMSPDWRLT